MLTAAFRSCILATLVSFASPAVTDAAAPAYDPVGPRVRGATPEMTRVIEQGIKRSSTFAALVAALNRTRVIVYVQESRELPGGVDGHLAVTNGRNRQRYLRAQVLSGLGLDDTIAIVGHELQHALEVAEHDEVTDAKSLGELYRRIGIQAPHGRFDTAAAQATGKRVRVELG